MLFSASNPQLAATVTVYVPGGVASAVPEATVTIFTWTVSSLGLRVESATVAGDAEQVAPRGNPLHSIFTEPRNSPTGTICTLNCALPPAAIVAVVVPIAEIEYGTIAVAVIGTNCGEFGASSVIRSCAVREPTSDG